MAGWSARPRPPRPIPAPAPPPAPKTTIDADGTYAIGTDIQPGMYSSAGPSATAPATGNGSTARSIVDNALSKKPQIVQIEATDTAFTTNECQPWQLTDAPPPPRPGAGDLLGQLAQLAR